MPNREVKDFSQTDDQIHSNVCSHAKMLLCALMDNPGGEVLLVNCCDSVRRVYDTIPRESFSFQRILDLPHQTEGFAIDLYARQLQRFADAYASYCHHSYDPRVLLDTWKRNAQAWEEMQNGQDRFIAVLGARPSDQLLQKMRQILPYPVCDLTCGGLRSIPAPPAGLDAGSEDLLRLYAKALLAQIPCMRMSDASGRSQLICHKGLMGIVYHSVRFCDYYSFEYAKLRRETDLPILKIESDYTAQSEGQLSTRLEAYRETSLSAAPFSGTRREIREGGFARIGTSGRVSGTNVCLKTDSSNRFGAYRHDIQTSGAIYIGIDSGSTTTNGAAIDEKGTLVACSIVRTGAKAANAAQRVYEELKQQLGSNASCIRKIVATGYGREHIPFADDVRTEISCHARGAHYSNPAARTIIDIGGQDSKVICLDQDGNVTNFVMNDKCAAGTGRFLEMMARTLELDLEQMGTMGLSWKKDLDITSTCTVFAESEVVSLIAENCDTNDIVHALNKSVARKTASMCRRVQGKSPYMMTGGVARNQGVVRELEKSLGETITILPHPDLNGALGAALYAME